MRDLSPRGRAGPERKLLAADDLLLDLERHAQLRIVEDRAVVEKAGQLLWQSVAACAIDAAGKRVERVKSDCGLHAVCLCVDAVPQYHRARRLARKQARSFDDLRGRNAGDLCCDARLVLACPLTQRLGSDAPSRDELAVVDIFAEHHVDHRQRERRVRPWLEPQPQVRHARDLSAPWIDDDQLGARFLRGFNMHPLHDARIGRALADDEYAARARELVAALRADTGQHRRRVAASLAHVLVDHAVRRADAAQQLRHGNPAAAEMIGNGASDRKRAVLLYYTAYAVGNLLERRVP